MLESTAVRPSLEEEVGRLGRYTQVSTTAAISRTGSLPAALEGR